MWTGCRSVRRQDLDRPGQIVAHLGQQLHLPVDGHSPVLRDPGPQHPLGQQVGEPGRQPQRRAVDAAQVLLEEQAEHRAVRGGPVLLGEREPGVVPPLVEVPHQGVAQPHRVHPLRQAHAAPSRSSTCRVSSGGVSSKSHSHLTRR